MRLPLLTMDIWQWISFLAAYGAVVGAFSLWISRHKRSAPAGAWRSTILPFLAFLALSGIWFAWALRFSQTGWDFTQFYIAAHLPEKSLYRRAAFTGFGESRLAPLGISYYPPYARPAVFALALKPLAWLSYWHAYWMWAAIGFAAYGAALYFLFRWLELPKALLPAFAAFFPAQFGIITGQDANVYLLVLLGGLLLLRNGKETAAGSLFALCTYKFNLLILLPVVLFSKARWKSLYAFGLGALLAAAASAALAPPSEYLALLRSIPSRTIGFIPGGVRGLLMRAGHENWYYPLALFGVAACAWLIWHLPLREAFCVAVTGGLLLAYHVTWYDCALLVIPIAVAWQRGGGATRTTLLALLVFPHAWILGKELFQVAAEAFLMVWFAAVAWDSGRNQSFEAALPEPELARAPGDFSSPRR